MNNTFAKRFAMCLALVGGTLTANIEVIKDAGHYEALCGAGPVIAMFSGSWCGPCQRTKPFFEKLSDHMSHIRFCYVDIDACADLSRAKNIRGVPTFMFSHEGLEAATAGGARSESDLKNRIQQLIDEVASKKKK